MRFPVPAVADLPRLDKDRQEHENRKGHGRFHRQQRKSPDRDPDFSRGGKGFEQDRSRFIGDGENGKKTQEQDLFSGEDLLRPGVQAIHDQRAQQQVDKDVEGEEAFFVHVIEGIHHQGMRVGRVLQQKSDGPDNIPAEEDQENDRDGRHGPGVSKQLLPVSFRVIQDPCKVRDQQEGQRQVGKVFDDRSDRCQFLSLVRVQPHADLYQGQDHR